MLISKYWQRSKNCLSFEGFGRAQFLAAKHVAETAQYLPMSDPQRQGVLTILTSKGDWKCRFRDIAIRVFLQILRSSVQNLTFLQCLD